MVKMEILRQNILISKGIFIPLTVKQCVVRNPRETKTVKCLTNSKKWVYTVNMSRSAEHKNYSKSAERNNIGILYEP